MADLDLARERFMAAAPPLDRSPPFRLLLARGPGRDSLILNAHHAAFDGRSCLRLLHLIADRYDAPRRSHGTVPRHLRAASPGPATDARPAIAAGPAAPGTRTSARASSDRPPTRFRPGRNSRIAPRHADGRRTRRAPGYGFALLGWPGVPTVPRPENGPRVTVNDLLIAALIEAVLGWNSAARAGGRAAS